MPKVELVTNYNYTIRCTSPIRSQPIPISPPGQHLHNAFGGGCEVDDATVVTELHADSEIQLRSELRVGDNLLRIHCKSFLRSLYSITYVASHSRSWETSVSRFWKKRKTCRPKTYSYRLSSLGPAPFPRFVMLKSSAGSCGPDTRVRRVASVPHSTLFNSAVTKIEEHLKNVSKGQSSRRRSSGN